MEHRHAVGEPARLAEEVGAQHDGASVLGGERADEVDHVAGGGGVEARGRLVQEQHLGVVQQGPGRGRAACAAGGEALDGDVGPVGHAEALEQVARRAARTTLRSEAAHPGGEHEVLACGEALVEAGVLGEHAGAPADLVAVDRGIEAEHPRGRASGARTPLRRRTVVVLPAPFGPSSASTSPCSTSRVRPSSATPLGKTA